MKYHEKLEAMIEFIEDNFTNVNDLVEWLEISIEDIVNLFPDSLVNNYEKVFTLDLKELDELSDAEELQAWNGVEVYGVFQPKEDFWEETEG